MAQSYAATGRVSGGPEPNTQGTLFLQIPRITLPRFVA